MRLVDLSVVVCVRLCVCVHELAEMCTLTSAFQFNLMQCYNIEFNACV